MASFGQQEENCVSETPEAPKAKSGVLMSLPYSSDLAQSDYYLFLSMPDDFGMEKFTSRCLRKSSVPVVPQ